MRRRSLAGPVLLILVGGVFLLYNLRPQIPVFELFSVYWPFLLIAWGLLRLAEVLVSAARSEPQRAGLSGGEVALVVILCLVGSGMFAAHRHGFRFNVRSLEVFGEQYEYPISDQKALGTAKRIVFENARGNLRITGGDAPDIKVTGRKSIRAFSKGDADRASQNTPLEFIDQGDQLLVRTNQDRVASNQRISEDLEVVVPRGVGITANASSGDFDVSDLDQGVEISADRADVRLNRIGGAVRVELRHSDIIRVMDVKGSVDVQGRGTDVDLENIAGQVTLNGSYGGSLEFKNLAKPLHFESQNTDLRVEKLPGEISMDLGEFTARNLVGPVRFVTKSRDVKIEDFTESLELETERGDIDLVPNHLPLPRITARSRAGRIDLVLPDKAAFQLEATAERGDAMNDFGPVLVKETDGRSASLRGKVGQGPSILLVTERGSVSVRKAGASGGTSEAKL
ncbi:MAG TPA: DUF4097 family beta strand repeat-containing protein [Bryobacteraceae bacterium]|nr:DUF4097 family beta strand repeat-containing protein [Bryobacteraceae bacterium]